MELNKVFLIGNLTKDPELRNLPSGMSVANMRLASNRRYSGRDGQRQEEVLYVDVEAWGKTAELCGQYLRRGSQILIDGRLKLNEYTTQSGEQRSRIIVVADRVQFGAKAEGSGGGGGGDYGSGGGGGSYRSGGGSNRSGEQQAPSAPRDDYDDPGHTDDDVPF